MLKFLIRRILLAISVAVCVSILTFALLHIATDPAIAIAGEDASAEEIEALRIAYGFNRPLYIQYADWLSKAVRGDLGVSPYFGLEVRSLIADRLPITIKLGSLSIVFALVLGIPLGVTAAIYPNTLIDRLSLSVAVFGQAIPNFWFGLLLIYVLSVQFRLLPASGTEGIQSFIMPMIVLGTNAVPAIMRLTRTGMLEVLGSDYIRTAWAKGMLPRQVYVKHALRNAVVPVVSVAAIQAAHMLGGSIVVEAVFALHGLGSLAYESILRSDIPTMQAIIILFSSFFIIFSALSDIANAYIDPRIRIS
ncbi:MAG TPA: ABC transporter permease [Gammaproteobacteria bacterium]|jgi:peptide/nickel transport system permease protein|nr:MAG: ABC transporter permease [Rhodobacter sp. BACL10 MAG-120910-bin24]MDA1287401.1 ABC transporter permease [Pseudomonadota bacterium]HAJ31257.1 ABC transporter permease [Gammaproteobacteria bacterium]|tara:strand:+ start:7219 stop:8136 length:918 start_codon:yes stop_codon:yes gene_type:complete